jgi:hypothetical protein
LMLSVFLGENTPPQKSEEEHGNFAMRRSQESRGRIQ